ncbi:MAG: hypothetical protein P8Z31_10255 [Gammaproteobacteria bacterium]
MIVLDAEIMRDFVNQRSGYFVAKFILRQAHFQVGTSENVDDVRQLTSVISTAFRQRHPEVKAQQSLPFRIKIFMGTVL